MHMERMCWRSTPAGIVRAALLGISATATVSSGWAAQDQGSSELVAGIEQSESSPSYTHMPETLRSSVKNVVVVAGQRPTGRGVSGTYDKDTPGLIGGMDEGSRLGTFSKEIGGVPVSIPIPILTIPGAIYGGLSGATKREIQEFRDALTEQLANADSQPLRHDGLALDVFWGLRRLPNLDSKLFSPKRPIPEDIDTVLFVSLDDLAIDVQGKQAMITSSARATLRRLSDGRDLYDTVIEYQDRATLGDWTEDGNTLWRDYANFARHYLGRELSAEVFDRIELRHELRPLETETTEQDRKDDRLFVSESTTPTLAWELSLLGGDPYGSWNSTIREEDIVYDVEIYDRHQLVYGEKGVPDPRHTLLVELESCQTYSWTVRPSYHVDGDVRFGESMRFKPDDIPDIDTVNGIIGRDASEAPAYIQDFALLEIECGRR